ncbi:MAG TPA: hypothetical protein VIZ43_08515 [Trebonia sp.]
MSEPACASCHGEIVRCPHVRRVAWDHVTIPGDGPCAHQHSADGPASDPSQPGAITLRVRNLGRGEFRCAIEDALLAWVDQTDMDLPNGFYDPNEMKDLARFVRDQLEARLARGLVSGSDLDRVSVNRPA